MKRRILGVLLIMMMLFVAMFTGCGSKPETPAATTPDATTDTPAADSDVIKIGVNASQTGPNATGGGLDELEGITIANEMFPEILGKKIEVVPIDNQSDKVGSEKAAKDLVAMDGMAAVIGCATSGLSIAAGPTYLEAQIPAVAGSATNPAVTEGNEYYFRVCFLDPFQGTVMAKYAFNDLKATKAAILQEVSNVYSVGLGDFFAKSFKELTGDANAVVATEGYNTGDQDFSAQLDKIKAANPEVIFAPGSYSESANFIKQARAKGITVPILGGDTWEVSDFIATGGADVEGAVLSTFYDVKAFPSDVGDKFIAAYKAKYNKDPNGLAANAFDAYLVIYKAIEKANSAKATDVRDALAKTADVQGAAGMITLDENRNGIKSAVLKKVENGQFVYLTTVDPK